jgi:hypothetical protein
MSNAITRPVSLSRPEDAKAVSNFSYLNVVSLNLYEIILLPTPVVNQKVFGKDEPKDPFASTSISIYKTQKASISGLPMLALL